MTRLHLRLLALALGLATLSPKAASAKDMNGKFGFGAIQTFGGVSGLSLRYFVLRSVSLEVDAAVSFASLGDGQTATAFVGGAAVFYTLAQSRTTNLLIGLRGDFGVRSEPSDAPETPLLDAVNRKSTPESANFAGSLFQFNLEIPIVIEHFFSDSFSINISTGVLMVFVPEQGAFLESRGVAYEDASFILALGSGGFIGSLGATYWF